MTVFVAALEDAEFLRYRYRYEIRLKRIIMVQHCAVESHQVTIEAHHGAVVAHNGAFMAHGAVEAHNGSMEAHHALSVK